MDPVETQYVERDGGLLAYQVIGNGRAEIVLQLEVNGHLDLIWTDPHCHALYERVAPTCRLLVMQRRGVGLSDQTSECPTVETQAADVLAVMDAAGTSRATLAGTYSACAAVALVAATQPDRVRNLLLIHPFAAGGLAPNARDAGWETDAVEAKVMQMREVVRKWGSGRSLDIWDPDLATPYNRRLMGLMERCSATPAAAMANVEFVLNLDFIEIFRAVPVYARVLGVRGNIVPEAVVRRVADLICSADFVPLPENPPGTSIGQAFVPIFDHAMELAGSRAVNPDLDRVLGTVLFTDLVKSTELLSRIGDAAYRDLRAAHERQVRFTVEETGGRLVNVIGDGTISMFDRASDAVRCAESICARSDPQHVAVRAGVHSGELERTGMDITGMTVHVGARIAALAGPGEVLVSQTVKDLLLGSGLQFRHRGSKALKGVPGRWELFALAGHAPVAAQRTANQLLATPADRLAVRIAQRAPRLARGAIAVGNAWQRRRAAAH